MGQLMCSMNNHQLTQTINQLAIDDLQIPNDDQQDNVTNSQSRFNFLKTEVSASWNILRQQSTNRLSTDYTFSTLKLTPRFNPVEQPSNNSQNCQISPLKSEKYTIDAPIQIVSSKKYKSQVIHEKFYENLQIDVSNFIKIRTENISEFYDFKQKVGQGTFGYVYRSIEKRTGQVRAIKVLKKKSMNNTSKMSFIAQIDLLKTLDHPNIIKLYDLFLYDGNYYVITQFCEGGSLQNYFIESKNHISESTTKTIMKQLISVINYMYSTSIVHRDLKMENIVFLNKITQESFDFQIRLIDFGTATKIQKHKKNSSGLVGTLLYIAPQFTRGFFTEKCDVWSAGVILYRLLFKDFPFNGVTEKQILHQITTKQLEWTRLQKSGVSAKSLQLVKLMLDKNYLTRASSKTLVQHPWIHDAFKQRPSKQFSQNAAAALAQYNRKNNFVSVIESFLSFKKVTQQERQQLAKMFFEIDNDNSGLIETQELIQFFKQKYPEYKQSKIIEIVQNVDKNNSGKIDFNEFITAVSKKSELFAEQALKQAFDYVDDDGTGFITKKELKLLLKEADRRQIEEIFENLDSDGDNQISLQEFRMYLLSV